MKIIDLMRIGSARPLSDKALERIADDLSKARYIVAPLGYRYKANEEPENRHPRNKNFRRRIAHLRIAEYELEQSGKIDAATGVRRVIDELVNEQNYRGGWIVGDHADRDRS